MLSQVIKKNLLKFNYQKIILLLRKSCNLVTDLIKLNHLFVSKLFFFEREQTCFDNLSITVDHKESIIDRKICYEIHGPIIPNPI